MIFEKLAENELSKFFEISVPSYAKDKKINEGMPEAEALKLAKSSFSKLFPDNKILAHTHIYKVLSESNEHMGYAWFDEKENFGKRYAFIYDVLLFEEYRGRGFGKMLMLELEKKVKKLGIDSIGLHVFGNNEIALNLYKKLGFKPTNIVMRKELKI